jgi:hypothetical protein
MQAVYGVQTPPLHSEPEAQSELAVHWPLLGGVLPLRQAPATRPSSMAAHAMPPKRNPKRESIVRTTSYQGFWGKRARRRREIRASFDCNRFQHSRVAGDVTSKTASRAVL